MQVQGKKIKRRKGKKEIKASNTGVKGINCIFKVNIIDGGRMIEMHNIIPLEPFSGSYPIC